MTDEAWKALTIIIPSSVTILAGLFYRVWSHREHKGSGEDIRDIKIYMNGEFEKRLAEEKRKWEQEYIKNKT